MKALSIRQPWAWLIVNGGKDVENRDWPTRYRGLILIHAGKGMTLDEYESADYFASVVAPTIDVPPRESLERGGVVGIAELADCVERSESPWFCGKYGFVLRNVRPLPFMPWRGELGLFEIPQPAALDRGALHAQGSCVEPKA